MRVIGKHGHQGNPRSSRSVQRVSNLAQATLALADAGIPMRDLVVACTAGMPPGGCGLLNGEQNRDFSEVLRKWMEWDHF
jgi:hypothetical protein